MKIYIDSEFRCYTAPGSGRTEAETDFFDGKAPDYIRGYRYIPRGQRWVREDGRAFAGEMIAPWRPWEALRETQQDYERERLQELENRNEELVAAMAEMVEEVYQSDLEAME